MLTSPIQTSRNEGALPLLLAGVLTVLGYLGRPWWLGWPATKTLELGERVLTLSERGSGWQVSFFALAVAVNLLCWAVPIRVLLAWRRSRHRS